MALWKSILCSATVIINMRIVNILFISKGKVLRRYVNLIVKVFAESFEITVDEGRERGLERGVLLNAS